MVVLFQKCFFCGIYSFTISTCDTMSQFYDGTNWAGTTQKNQKINSIREENGAATKVTHKTAASTIAITEKQNKSDILFVVF